MNAERMNMANATAKIEGSKEARPPGGFPLASAPKKIFICSPYQPTANDPPCRKAQLEANIQRAKTACRILATMGVLPLAPHLYFTQFLKDEDAQERATGKKPFQKDTAGHLFSSRQMDLIVLNRLGVKPEDVGQKHTEPKKPDAKPPADPEPSAELTPPAEPPANSGPVLDMDGKTEDGSIPYNILMKQLECMK